jgi:hypothetical protein
MIGLLLLTVRPAPAGIWRWCSGFAFVMFLLFAVTMTKIFRRLDLQQIQREHATRFVFYLFGTLGIAANLLQLYKTAFLDAFWPHGRIHFEKQLQPRQNQPTQPNLRSNAKSFAWFHA